MCTRCASSTNAGREVKALSRPNWSRPLPRPLKIPAVMTLRTLADVRDLVEKHLPAERRERDTWRHVAKCFRGGDVASAVIALLLSLERVAWF